MSGLDILGGVSDQINQDVSSGKFDGGGEGDRAQSTSTPNENKESPDKSNDVAASAEKGTTSGTPNKSLFDLGKTEKVWFEGKEWTVKDLKAAILRQNDYTKKTQELARERERDAEFATNLPYDLQSLKKNPKLLSNFKEIYPERYHKAAEQVLEELEQIQKTSAEDSGKTGPDTYLKGEVEKIRRELQNQFAPVIKDVEKREQEAINAQLDGVFSDMAKRHKLEKDEADIVEEIVLSRADTWLNQNPRSKPSKENWTEWCDQAAKKYQKLQDDAYARKIKSQKTASSKVRDTGAGGGSPGSPPKRESIAEATERAIRELSQA